MRSGFQTRIVAVVVTVLAGVGLASVAVVNARIEGELQREQTRRLQTADAVFRHAQRTRVRALQLRHGTVPNEPRFKAVSQLGEPKTLRYTLEDIRGEQGCDAILYESGAGMVTAAGTGLPADEALTQLAHDALEAAADDRGSAFLAVAEGRLFDVVGVPVRVGESVVGGLAFVSEVADPVLRELAQLTGGEVAFFAGRTLLVASDRRVAGEPGLVEDSWAEGEGAQAQRIGADRYLVHHGRPEGAAAGTTLHYALFASLSGPLAALRETQRLLVYTSLMGLAVGGLLVWLFIRRAARPLRVLGEHAEAVGRGDFSRRVRTTSRDEFGVLGQAFNRMTENLDASRRELEQAVVNLQRTREQLVQREKLSSLGEFVAGVTHELNNPLTAIIGYAEMLQAAGLPAQQGEDVAAIVNGAQRCQRIVRNLLGFARQHKPERRPVCLNALVEDVLGFMGYELRTGNVTVERALEPDLPACEVDPHQIQQVLLNILSNARQALEGYRKDARIEVRTVRAGDRVQVSIADNGPGIPAEHLRRVFDPFFTTKPAGRGTGLGLSLAYGIVQEHGGTITADSTPGAGARFTLEFPAASAALDPRLAPAAAALPEREGEGVRVLVVDDEPAIRDLIRSLLTPRGYVVSEASDGEAALRWLGERRVDLVVCDLRMPGLGGLPFFERLKVERPELAERVIFMTGDVMNPVAQQLAREQGRVCLAKPFSGDEFRRALHRVRQSCT